MRTSPEVRMKKSQKRESEKKRLRRRAAQGQARRARTRKARGCSGRQRAQSAERHGRTSGDENASLAAQGGHLARRRRLNALASQGGDSVKAPPATANNSFLRELFQGPMALLAAVVLTLTLIQCGHAKYEGDPESAESSAQSDGDDDDSRSKKDKDDGGGPWITHLTEKDTIFLTDLTDTSLGETDGYGRRRTEVSVYPYGLARYDTSRRTRLYASTPRDRSVGLDHMGSRFYSPQLGTFTSGDPAILTKPEQYVTEEFAAANPYAYANLRPVIAADRDGQFWHLAAGALAGGLVGGGVEAVTQYAQHGKIESWGRIGAASSGGASAGLLTTANPAAGIASVMGMGAASNMLGGLTTRLVGSGGKDAGTLLDVAVDAGVGAATGGIVKGGGGLLRKVLSKKPVAPPAAKAPVSKVNVPGVKTSSDDFAHWVKSSDPKAFARLEPTTNGLSVTDLFRGNLPPGSGATILAEGLRSGGLRSGQQLSFSNITNRATREAFQAGVPAADSLLGKVGSKALGQIGLKGTTFEFQVAGDKLGLTIGVQ